MLVHFPGRTVTAETFLRGLGACCFPFASGVLSILNLLNGLRRHDQNSDQFKCADKTRQCGVARLSYDALIAELGAGDGSRWRSFGLKPLSESNHGCFNPRCLAYNSSIFRVLDPSDNSHSISKVFGVFAHRHMLDATKDLFENESVVYDRSRVQ